MRVSDCVGCKSFPCKDVRHECYLVPDIEVNPGDISIILISEAVPPDPDDYYYASGDPLFQQTTIQAFNEAGSEATSIRGLVAHGVYLTTAVKCGKTGYGIQTDTIKECSHILDREIALFPQARAVLLMGDVAIQAINSIARRGGGKRVIPASSTYKIRSQEFYFRGMRAFPSYLQAGPSFFVEKSKRKMIAEDIAEALKLVMSRGDS